MTIINPDHEAAIAAFHRAAARAGVGGDGRYARAVTFLEPSVRRELEAAAPQLPAEAQAQGGGEMMAGELRPCPFCGAPAERIDFGPGDAENGGGSCIACTQCQSSGPVEFGRKENFVSNWNRRTAPPSAPVGVEGLVNDLHLIAVQGETPDGDGVTVNVQLWADRWVERLAQQPAAVDGATLRQALYAMKRCQREAGGRQWEPWITKVEAALAAQPGGSDRG